jgi:hypothetical protein
MNTVYNWGYNWKLELCIVLMKVHCVAESLLEMFFTYCYFLRCREKESNKEDQDNQRGRNRRFDKTHVYLFILESFKWISVKIKISLWQRRLKYHILAI